MRRRTGLAAAGAAVLAAALVLLPATAASAHDYLIGSTPGQGDTVKTEVRTITLDYDDIVQPLDGRGAFVEVTDAAGRHYETDCATVEGRDVITSVALGEAGTYTVNWRVVSADGHPVASSPNTAWPPVIFHYDPPKGTTPSAGHASALARCGFASSGNAPTAAPAATGEISTTVVVALVAAGAVVLLAIIAVAVLLLIARRRRRE